MNVQPVTFHDPLFTITLSPTPLSDSNFPTAICMYNVPWLLSIVLIISIIRRKKVVEANFIKK